LSPYRKGKETDKKLCPIKIEYHNQEAQASLMLGDSWRVELQDDLIRHLEGWLSKENVKILYN
jgi:DNA polymerase-3 subunit alpha